MADKTKKNIYRKTMGFTHKDTTTISEDFSRSFNDYSSRIKNFIQQSGYGKKEPHKFVGNGKFVRPNPSYKKDKYEGQATGREMSNLARFGNASNWTNDPFARRMARRKLVKGT